MTFGNLAGRYSTIVVDPPWPLQGIGNYKGNGFKRALPYDEMTLADVREFPFGDLAGPFAHAFVWATHKHLPLALEMLGIQGFAYRWTGVWHKDGGPQLPGMPRLNCEFIVYGNRGGESARAGMFDDTRAFNACFNASRGRHSEKPAYFYQLLERVTPAPRIDVFARRRHAGFDAWGNEVEEHCQQHLGLV